MEMPPHDSPPGTRMLTQQEKTDLAIRQNIDRPAWIKQHGFRAWCYEMVRGLGRHPWPKYFELTDFYGDKRHGDIIPRTWADVKKLKRGQVATAVVCSGMLLYIFGLGTWCKRNNTAWSESIHQEYGFKQPYTRKFRAEHDGVTKPKIPAIY